MRRRAKCQTLARRFDVFTPGYRTNPFAVCSTAKATAAITCISTLYPGWREAGLRRARLRVALHPRIPHGVHGGNQPSYDVYGGRRMGLVGASLFQQFVDGGEHLLRLSCDVGVGSSATAGQVHGAIVDRHFDNRFADVKSLQFMVICL